MKQQKNNPHIPECIRWQIVGFLQAGKLQKEAADYYEVDPGTVSRIGAKFLVVGDVCDYPRSGRPKKADTKKKLEISEKMEEEKQRYSLRSLTGATQLCPATVRTILLELGYSYKHFLTIPKLTSKHIKERQDYCKFGKDSILIDNMIFVDESYFLSFRNSLGMGTKENQIYKEKSQVKYSVMVGAGISMRGKTKLYIKNSGLGIDSEVYVSILEEFLMEFAEEKYPDGNFWLVQDNAPSHSSKFTKQGIEANIPCFCKHPPNSPDLNPIELVGKPMKDFIEKHNPQTKEELEMMLNQAWEAIQMETIENCIIHFKKRLQVVFDKNGEYV